MVELPYSEDDVWSFKKDDRGRWIWLRQSAEGEVLLASRASFDRLEECVADARKRGYSGSFSVSA